MSEFVRENRYVVIKLSHLNIDQREDLEDFIHTFGINPVECVVIERDWSVYEDAWKLVEKEASL